MGWSMEVLGLLFIIVLLIYLWVKRTYSYFERFNIPCLPTTPFLGSLKSMFLFQKSAIDVFYELYHHKVAENQPFVGLYVFHKPALLIRDPELIKRIYVTDFNYFSNRSGRADAHSDPLGSSTLFFLKNPGWKYMRANLSPFFTSGKLKNSFYLVLNAAADIETLLSKEYAKRTPDWDGIEFKDLCARYTTDVIASIAFGVNANSIQNPNAEFRKAGKRVIDFTWKRAFDMFSVLMMPEIVPIFKCSLFSTESADFLRSAVIHVMEEREKSGLKRNDLIDILIELKNSPKSKDAPLSLEGDVLISQAAFFFIAGFETSSSAMTFALYELSKNPKIQEKARQEIKTILGKSNGEITYENLNEMEYLTAIIQETTRLYPVLPFLDRECTPPPGEKGYSLAPFSDFVVPKGMTVFVSPYPIHKDPKYFEDPDVFKPERYLAENKTKNPQMLSLGFGIGPHNCIGERLGILQAKAGVVNILKNFSVKHTHKTPKVIEFDKKAVNAQVVGGLYLDIVKDPLILNK